MGTPWKLMTPEQKELARKRALKWSRSQAGLEYRREWERKKYATDSAYRMRRIEQAKRKYRNRCRRREGYLEQLRLKNKMRYSTDPAFRNRVHEHQRKYREDPAHKEAARRRSKRWLKIQSDECSDYYLKGLGTPPELLEVKRAQLKLLRIVRKFKNNN